MKKEIKWMASEGGPDWTQENLRKDTCSISYHLDTLLTSSLRTRNAALSPIVCFPTKLAIYKTLVGLESWSLEFCVRLEAESGNKKML